MSAVDMNKLEGIAKGALGFVKAHAYAERVMVIAERNIQGRMEARAYLSTASGHELSVTLTDPPEGGDGDACPF